MAASGHPHPRIRETFDDAPRIHVVVSGPPLDQPHLHGLRARLVPDRAPPDPRRRDPGKAPAPPTAVPVNLDTLVATAAAQRPRDVVQVVMGKAADPDAAASVKFDAQTEAVLRAEPDLETGFMSLMLRLHASLLAGLPGTLVLGGMISRGAGLGHGGVRAVQPVFFRHMWRAIGKITGCYLLGDARG